MNKSTFFTGQPIFTQLLKFIPKDSVVRIARERKADYYSKRFNTYEHLVTMLYLYPQLNRTCVRYSPDSTSWLARRRMVRLLAPSFMFLYSQLSLRVFFY